MSVPALEAPRDIYMYMYMSVPALEAPRTSSCFRSRDRRIKNVFLGTLDIWLLWCSVSGS